MKNLRKFLFFITYTLIINVICIKLCAQNKPKTYDDRTKPRLSNLNEISLQRFEWGDTYATVLTYEKLVLYKKGKYSDGEYHLDYRGTIGGIDVEIKYDFKYDELSTIRIYPVREPLFFPGGFVKTDFNTAYHEFTTFKLKLLKLLGNTFYECTGESPGYCQERDGYKIRNSTTYDSKSEVYTKIQSFFIKEDFGIAEGFSCYLINKWIDTTNNSTYELALEYLNEKELENEEDKKMQCNWHLIIRPTK